MEKLEKGCVYFFKHIGLTPVKIGCSSNESPCNRFNSFKTYAPYGSELIGFIRTIEPRELEFKLHKKFSNKRLEGEWFEITIDEVKKEIEFYSDIQDIIEMNKFQIEWAEKLFTNKIELNPESNFSLFKDEYIKNTNLNRSHSALKYSVSRKTIHDWINSIEKK